MVGGEERMEMTAKFRQKRNGRASGAVGLSDSVQKKAHAKAAKGAKGKHHCIHEISLTSGNLFC